MDDVLQVLEAKPEFVHVLITGRDCPQQILEKADLATEMKKLKHPFDDGVAAQLGLDY
jgi:cob(I)alamin adenosyltransferase